MKRSEMINIIANYLYELNVEQEDCEDESNRILTELERRGMLPPMLGLEEVTKRVIAKGEWAKVHDWEPEIDKGGKYG